MERLWKVEEKEWRKERKWWWFNEWDNLVLMRRIKVADAKLCLRLCGK